MGRISLNGTWSLAWAEGAGRIPSRHYTAQQLDGARTIPARVPAPIHQLLLEQGLIDDPNLGLNSHKALWIEEQFWIYRRTFTAPAPSRRQRAWLTFDKLEYDATIFLNGEKIGTHANAHRPARLEITGKLLPGQNLLVVKLDTGLFAASDKPAAHYATGEMGLLNKRHWLRRPQYQTGWDWSARLSNVGILGDVSLEWSPSVRLDQLSVVGDVSPDLSRATVRVRAFIESPKEGQFTGTLSARILETGAKISTPMTIDPKSQSVELALEIPHPKLWWPTGQGDQFRYTVEIALTLPGLKGTHTRKLGLRRVEMDQSPHPVTGRYCTLKINNRPIFCKGANFVPSDLLYSTVDAARKRALIDLAVQANFNLFRIWGGGVYADHEFLDLCDDAGIMLWHDFAFACGKYPGDDPAFCKEVRKEVTYIVRELSHHPSLVVWCGNNEIELADWQWGHDAHAPTHPHYHLFHHDIPQIVTRENPSAVHWISSPWSPDYKLPTDPTVGNQHPWDVWAHDPGPAEFYAYRQYIDRFATEGGVMGASSPATLRQFLPPDQRQIHSPAWEHHDNPFAATNRYHAGRLGRAYETVQVWTGQDPRKIPMEDYAFLSALLQAEGLSEYITNYRRRMFSSSAAIFWMYNDSWPVTHGWTIVDYYLRKKLAYHPVRRAFQPITVVVAREDDQVKIFGVNDTPAEFRADLQWGLFTLKGRRPIDQSTPVTLSPNASTLLATMPFAPWQELGTRHSGAFAVLWKEKPPVPPATAHRPLPTAHYAPIAQHRLFLERFKDLTFAEPKIRLHRRGPRLTLSSDVFVWSVCLDLDGESPLADNCFDLLPGIPYALDWPKALPTPHIHRTASASVARPSRPRKLAANAL